MEKIEIIHTPKAPEAIGPYSQAIRVGQMLFCSGQVPFIPGEMKIIEGGIKEQTKRVCENIAEVLKESGCDFSRVVKTTCFLKDMNQFSDFNQVYAEYFGSYKPARSTVEVARLPKDVLVEIECIAVF